VNARPITVTANAQSREYGDPNPTTGTVALTSGSLVGGDTLGSASVTSPATATSGVGAYALTPSAQTFTSGTAGNYAITYLDGALNITPAMLTVTASNASRNYGDADPVFSGTITGFRNGETSAVLATQPGYSTTALISSSVGSYPIVGGGAVAGNYLFTYVNGSLAVAPRPITVTAANQNRYYGDANPTAGGVLLSAGSLVGGDTLGLASVTSPATATSGVGAYALTPSAQTFASGAAGNYAITYLNGSLSVDPAPLYYVSDAKSRYFSAPNPPFTGVMSGFKNGDSLAGIASGTPLFDSPATQTTAPGLHPIYGSGLTLTSGNYVLAQAAGNGTALTILADPVNTPAAALASQVVVATSNVLAGADGKASALLELAPVPEPAPGMPTLTNLLGTTGGRLGEFGGAGGLTIMLGNDPAEAPPGYFSVRPGTCS
jgi:hypothetical protein